MYDDYTEQVYTLARNIVKGAMIKALNRIEAEENKKPNVHIPRKPWGVCVCKECSEKRQSARMTAAQQLAAGG